MACRKLLEVDTLLTADSVEWCPCENLHQVLAGGTYQLDEETRLRHGALSLYEWNHQNLVQVFLPESKKVSDGILDMKWNSVSGQAVLALAASNGAVSCLQLDVNDSKYSLLELGSCVVAEHNGVTGLSLSLDWRKHLSESSKQVAVSDSLGYVSLVELCQSGPAVLRCWKAHQFEAWIVACGSDDHTVYSGGDDCRLCQWDTRDKSTKPSFTSKRHTMGVCSLQVHPEIPHLLSSGSYDEIMYVWDIRNLTSPLKEGNLGGGIWRIKWCPLNPDLAAAACMHNHFQVIRGNLRTGEPLKVLSSYCEHKSLAYGVDWCQVKPAAVGEHKDSPLTLASCSFYDHSLHIWNYSTNLD